MSANITAEKPGNGYRYSSLMILLTGGSVVVVLFSIAAGFIATPPATSSRTAIPLITSQTIAPETGTQWRSHVIRSAEIRRKLFTSGSPRQRAQGVYSCVAVQDVSAQSAIRLLLLNERDPAVIGQCIRYLGLFGTSADSKLFIAALDYNLGRPLSEGQNSTNGTDRGHAEATLALARRRSTAGDQTLRDHAYRSDVVTRSRAIALEAIENNGQIDSRVDFYSLGGAEPNFMNASGPLVDLKDQ